MRVALMKLLAFATLCFAFISARAEIVSSFDHGSVPEAEAVRAILRQPEAEMDLAKVKLAIDKIIDPSIDIEANLGQIDEIVNKVRISAGDNPTSAAKVLALRQHLYDKGSWNDYRPYQYDFSDPKGTGIANKLLPQYLKSRKGNCVSMPFLFIILGQRLGIDLTASTAPEHYFVKYTDPDSGATYNLEATSGGHPSRDAWYRQEMPMTDEAIANGIYLQKLTKTETAASMATVLVEHFAEQGEYKKVIAIADAILPFYPKDIALILWKGIAPARLIKKHFLQKYPNPNLIPPEERPYFHYLSEQNHQWFSRAEALGWRESDPSRAARYMQIINRIKTAK